MPQRISFKGFVGSAYSDTPNGQRSNIDSQILENWYLEISQSAYAKTPTALLPCPGFEVFCTLPGSPVRGAFSQNDRTFFVGGETLYEVSRNGAITTRPATALATPAAPTVTPSPVAPAIDPPNQPTVTHGGTVGTTTYGYRVTSVNAYGETTGSVEGTSATGNASLSATNYNLIQWVATSGATGYRIYRTTGPGAGVLIGSVGASVFQFIDIGTSGTSGSPPGSNTTGGTVGTTTYGYKIVARLGMGATAASVEGVTHDGHATNSAGGNYNTVSWPAIPNAHSYDVYRTTGGVSPPRFLGNTTATSINDAGADGESRTPPTVDTTGSATISDDGTPVSICSSGDAGNQLLIVSAGEVFCFDLETNLLAKVLDGATSAGYIATYFVVLDAATSTLKSSESLDGFTWDATQVYQRTAAGDRWLAMGVHDQEIWLFGSDSTDVWRATGNDATRFAPYSGITIPHGIIAASSLCRVDGAWMWVGQNRNGAGLIYRTNAYTATVVSTNAIARQAEGLETLADAVAWSYQQEQHEFYVVTFPNDDVTWVYDTTTGEWHSRRSWDANQNKFVAYRPQCHTFAFGGLGFGLHLVGDRLSGVVAKMSPDYGYDIDGSVIRRIRQAPHLYKDGLRIFYPRLEIDFEAGVGAVSGQGSDPTAMLSYANDGGKAFGPERWTSIGASGDHDARAVWTLLGSGRNRVFRLVVTDPVPYRIAGANLDIEIGIS